MIAASSSRWPLRGAYTVPANTDEGFPAKHYRSEVWGTRSGLAIEVWAHDEGFPESDVPLVDGDEAAVKLALGYEARLRRRVAPALRALIPAGARS